METTIMENQMEKKMESTVLALSCFIKYGSCRYIGLTPLRPTYFSRPSWRIDPSRVDEGISQRAPEILEPALEPKLQNRHSSNPITSVAWT